MYMYNIVYIHVHVHMYEGIRVQGGDGHLAT